MQYLFIKLSVISQISYASHFLQEIQEMRNRQQQKQVLDKPNLHPEANKKSTSSKKPPVAAAVRDPDDFEDPAAVEVVQPPKIGGSAVVGASGQGLTSYDVGK